MVIGVVGGGFWGTAIALRLNEAGIAADVIDDADAMGASRSAAGICKLTWYRQDTVRRMMNGTFTYAEFLAGFEWLGERVPVTHAPETFINDTLGGRRSEHADNYLAMPADLLSLGTRVNGAVTAVRPGPQPSVVLGTGEVRRYDAVVVAAGARTDRLLAASGLGSPTQVTGLLGRAVLFDADATLCTTVMIRPYRHYTFRRFGGRVRGGDTVERKRNDSALSELIATAGRLHGGLGQVDVLAGVRPVCPQMFVGPVGTQVYAATGGHRVGFGLAGAVSERMLALLTTR